MSRDRLLELAERRGALAAQAEMQRAALASRMWPVEAGLGAADQVVDGVQWLKRHPRAVFAIVAAVVVARPKRAWRWAKRGIVVWQGWKAVRQSIAG